MEAIHKWAFHVAERTIVEMPLGSRLLTVQEQHGYLTLWAEVDPAQPMVDHMLMVRGTGHKPPDKASYLATVQMTDGLVWHIYDGGEIPR